MLSVHEATAPVTGDRTMQNEFYIAVQGVHENVPRFRAQAVLGRLHGEAYMVCKEPFPFKQGFTMSTDCYAYLIRYHEGILDLSGNCAGDQLETHSGC